MPTKIITVSELKNRLGTLMSELEKHGVPLYVTQYGKPKAVVTRFEDYESLLNKLEDLEDIVTMREALTAPEDEIMKFEDYEQQRAARI